jgi:hypothetical protein
MYKVLEETGKAYTFLLYNHKEEYISGSTSGIILKLILNVGNIST